MAAGRSSSESGLGTIFGLREANQYIWLPVFDAEAIVKSPWSRESTPIVLWVRKAAVYDCGSESVSSIPSMSKVNDFSHLHLGPSLTSHCKATINRARSLPSGGCQSEPRGAEVEAHHSRGGVFIKLVTHEGVNAIAAEKEIRAGDGTVVKRNMHTIVVLCDLDCLSTVHNRELA